MVDLAGGDVGGGEHAVRLGVAGWRGDVEAGVGRQRQLDRRPAERPPDRLRVGAAHDAVQQGAGLLLGGGVGVVGAGQRPRRVEAGELLLDESRLGLDVEAGEHEHDLVAEPAERAEADLQRRRRRFAAHAADAHPVGTVVGELDRVEAGRHVRPGIPGAGDLVEQLRGDGLAGDGAAGAGMLGDHARCRRRRSRRSGSRRGGGRRAR